MIIRIEVKPERNEKYLPAVLTNEHPESKSGLPVVVIDGERQVRRPSQVYCLRVSDPQMAENARRGGYLVLRGRSVHEKSAKKR